MPMRYVNVLGLLLIGLTLGLHLNLTYSSCVKTIWVHRDLASRTTRPRPSVIITMPPGITRYTSKELYALRDKSVVLPMLLFDPVNYNSRQRVSEKKTGLQSWEQALSIYAYHAKYPWISHRPKSQRSMG
jgi:hypothetical protein